MRHRSEATLDLLDTLMQEKEKETQPKAIDEPRKSHKVYRTKKKWAEKMLKKVSLSFIYIADMKICEQHEKFVLAHEGQVH